MRGGIDVVEGVDDEESRLVELCEQGGHFGVETAGAGEAEVGEGEVEVSCEELGDAESGAEGVGTVDDAGAVVDEQVVRAGRDELEGGVGLDADAERGHAVAHGIVEAAAPWAARESFDDEVFGVLVLDGVVVGEGAGPAPAVGLVVVEDVEVDAGVGEASEDDLLQLFLSEFESDGDAGGVGGEVAAFAGGGHGVAVDVREVSEAEGDSGEGVFAFLVAPEESLGVLGADGMEGQRGGLVLFGHGGVLLMTTLPAWRVVRYGAGRGAVCVVGGLFRSVSGLFGME